MALENCPLCNSVVSNPKVLHHDERKGYNIDAIIKCKCGISFSVSSEEDTGGWCKESSKSVVNRCIKIWNKRG